MSVNVPAVEGQKRVSVVPRGVRGRAVKVKPLHFRQSLPKISENEPVNRGPHDDDNGTTCRCSAVGSRGGGGLPEKTPCSRLCSSNGSKHMVRLATKYCAARSPHTMVVSSGEKPTFSIAGLARNWGSKKTGRFSTKKTFSRGCGVGKRNCSCARRAIPRG